MNKPLATADLVPLQDGTAVVLPADVLARLGSASGDRIRFVETADGAIAIEAATDDVTQLLDLGRDIIRRRAHALTELAK
jgi:antitoxin component of MazEF toxin-antitoxin module